jgi:hypothetical protein
VVGALGLPIGAALPWVLSGQAKKSAFSLAKTARELGLVQAAGDLGIANETVVKLLLWTLFASPLLAGLLVLLFVFGQRVLAASVSLLIGLIGVIGGGAGTIFGEGGLIGPPVTLASGIVALIGTVLAWRNSRTTP